MERHRPARWLANIRYLLMALAVGIMALTVACGSSATAEPNTEPTFVPTVAPTATPDVASGGSTTTPPPDETPNTGPLVRVGDLDFPVELAANSDQRIRGLSGRASLDAGTGMLFIFEKPEKFRFWMREMEITLDIVWIGSNCEVVDVSENVPFPDPDTPLEDLPRYSPESKAKFVLEINGGESAEMGLGIGNKVEFLNEIAGEYDC